MVTTCHPLRISTLRALPTLAYRGCCQLKVENAEGDRWWLCSLPHSNHRITIERHRTHLGGWYVEQRFADKEPEL